MNFDWKKTLATVAPAIATALGSPVAGVAVSMACEALGLEESSETALRDAVATGKPDVLVRLRQIDAEFKKAMKSMDVDLEKIHASDRDSARRMAMAKGIIVQALLTFLLTGIFWWLLDALFGGAANLPETVKNIAFYAMGTLNALLIQSWNFWFGTSKGSSDKSDQLSKLMR